MSLINKEYILSWLQGYFFKNSSDLPHIVIGDEALKNHRTISDFSETLPVTASCLTKLYIVGNPGWSYRCFDHKNQRKWRRIQVDREENLEEDDYFEECFFDWFYTLHRDKEFSAGSGPQYLSVVLEAFRCFITSDKFDLQETDEDLKRLKIKLDRDNQLLAWLSEFAFKHSDPSMKLGYITLGFYMFVTKAGFVMVFMMEEMELGDCEFEDVLIEEPEGKIHCYRKGDNLIIRTHFRGLIKGLTIFRDWAEKHRDVWENIDWG